MENSILTALQQRFYHYIAPLEAPSLILKFGEYDTSASTHPSNLYSLNHSVKLGCLEFKDTRVNCRRCLAPVARRVIQSSCCVDTASVFRRGSLKSTIVKNKIPYKIDPLNIY